MSSNVHRRLAWWCSVVGSSALVVLLAGTPVQAAEPDPDLVTVVGASSATLPPADTAQQTFVVTPATGTAVTTLTATVLRVRRDAVEIPSGEPTVTSTMLSALPAVQLSVQSGALTRVGSYEVLVDIATRPPTARHQILTFTLTRDASTITVPATITVQKTLPFAWTLDAAFPGFEPDQKPRLDAVLGDESRIVELSARQAEPDAPLVTVTPSTLPTEAGSTIALHYDLAGDLPGESTRTVTLSSPQLAAPVSVTFDITVRRSPAVLLLALIAGVLAGLVVRTILPAISASIARRRKRVAFVREIDVLVARSHDAAYRTTLNEQRDAVREARGTDETVAAIAAATTAVADATADLQTRLSTETARLDSLGNAVRARRATPPDLVQSASLKQLRESRDAIAAKLKNRDAGGAKALLDQTANPVNQAMVDLATWVSTMRSRLDDLAALVAAKTHGAQGTLKLRLDHRQDPALQLPAAQAPPTIDDLGAALDTVERMELLLRAVHGDVLAVAQEATEASELLGSPPEVTAAVGTLASAAEQPLQSATSSDVTDAVEHLQQAYATAALASAPDKQAEVQARLDKGDVRGAAQVHRNLLIQEPAIVAAPVTLATTDPEGARPVVGTLEARWPVELALLTVAGWAVTLVVTAISFVAAIVTGYGLYIDDWVGTRTDIVQAFAWGFAVDLAVLSVAAILALQKTPAPAPA